MRSREHVGPEGKQKEKRTQHRRINWTVTVKCIMGYSQLPVPYIGVCGFFFIQSMVWIRLWVCLSPFNLCTEVCLGLCMSLQTACVCYTDLQKKSCKTCNFVFFDYDLIILSFIVLEDCLNARI